MDRNPELDEAFAGAFEDINVRSGRHGVTHHPSLRGKVMHGNDGGDILGMQGHLEQSENARGPDLSRGLRPGFIAGSGYRGDPSGCRDSRGWRGRGGSQGQWSRQGGHEGSSDQVSGPTADGLAPSPDNRERGGQRQDRGGSPQQGGRRLTFTGHHTDHRYQRSGARARATIDQMVDGLAQKLQDRSMDPTEFEDRLDGILSRLSDLKLQAR